MRGMLPDTDYSVFPRSALVQTCRTIAEQCRLAELRAEKEKYRADRAERELEAMRAQFAEKERIIAALQKDLYGSSSEKAPVVEPQVFLDITVMPEDEPEDDGQDDDNAGEEEIEEITYLRKKSKGRRPVSKTLPVKIIILHATEAESIGPNGEKLVCIGYEESARVDLAPEKLQRLIIKREKMGLPDTRELCHTVALPPCLVSGGKATDSFMLEVMLRKYMLGLPLYRQLQDYNNRGADLADNFLGQCVRHIARAFAPIAQAIREQVLAAQWVYADETPIKQLTKHNKNDIVDKNIHQSYFWAWIGAQQCYFHYGYTRGSKEVRDVMGISYDPDDPNGDNADYDPRSWEHGAYIGFIVCDGYSGYNPLFRTGDIKRVACWIHARRGFKRYEDDDGNARRIVTMINTIFHHNKQITKEADKRTLHGDERWLFISQQRQEILHIDIELLQDELLLLDDLYTPGSKIGEALTYISNRWEDLLVFLDYGFLPMENNTAERAVRPIAIGRKNWLFIGSEDAGHWAGTLFSIIESCRLQKIDPRAYCEHILNILVQHQADDLDYSLLTPAAMHKTIRKKQRLA